jgi:hypothetical protein
VFGQKHFNHRCLEYSVHDHDQRTHVIVENALTLSIKAATAKLKEAIADLVSISDLRCKEANWRATEELLIQVYFIALTDAAIASTPRIGTVGQFEQCKWRCQR